ncbi:putative gpi anchored serine-threonine rich protein [Erysiphe neolycopersici]|uniref:Putative gpi anchored serine-threonine rich protein n=1 Tax=Erysiphe neolycopersici TaxID=212602 RepID=A0A420HEF0_9PEZI|nr:putative gpi anchored serine-threonine rich protein [Erysiphe neolycopersici]
MRSSILLSIPFLCVAVSAIDLNTIPLPGVTELDTACAAQAVLDTCISSTTAIATSCSLTDYACLCQKNSDILTCFNTCPNDPRLAGVRSTQASYCANASAYPSSTTVAPSNSIASPIANTPTSSSSVAITHSSSIASTPTSSSTTTSESASPSETEKSESSKNYVSQFAMLIAIIAIIL